MILSNLYYKGVKKIRVLKDTCLWLENGVMKVRPLNMRPKLLKFWYVSFSGTKSFAADGKFITFQTFSCFVLSPCSLFWEFDFFAFTLEFAAI